RRPGLPGRPAPGLRRQSDPPPRRGLRRLHHLVLRRGRLLLLRRAALLRHRHPVLLRRVPRRPRPDLLQLRPPSRRMRPATLVRLPRWLRALRVHAGGERGVDAERVLSVTRMTAMQPVATPRPPSPRPPARVIVRG